MDPGFFGDARCAVVRLAVSGSWRQLHTHVALEHVHPHCPRRRSRIFVQPLWLVILFHTAKERIVLSFCTRPDNALGASTLGSCSPPSIQPVVISLGNEWFSNDGRKLLNQSSRFAGMVRLVFTSSTRSPCRGVGVPGIPYLSGAIMI